MNIKAFLLITIIAMSSIPLMAQQARPSFKEPGTAVLFSVRIPGGGHFYAGERGKGVALMAVSLGSIVLGAAIATKAARKSHARKSGGSTYLGAITEVEMTPILIGLTVSFGSWVYGIADSGNAARRANERNGYTLTSLRLVPIQTAISSPRPGLSFRMTF